MSERYGLTSLASTGASESKTNRSGGEAEPTDPNSSKGIIPGSGIGILGSQSNLNTGETLPESDPRNVLLFFQHHSGQIRWMERRSSGEWSDGSNSSIIATDAKAGTPIGVISSATTYSQWHVFCKFALPHLSLFEW